MVLLEAMAAGVPLICSDCGGGREVVNGVGLLFPLGDVKALAGCLVQCELAATDVWATPSNERLSGFFSDVAVRTSFWQLPLVRRLISPSSTC